MLWNLGACVACLWMKKKKKDIEKTRTDSNATSLHCRLLSLSLRVTLSHLSVISSVSLKECLNAEVSCRAFDAYQYSERGAQEGPDDTRFGNLHRNIIALMSHTVASVPVRIERTRGRGSTTKKNRASNGASHVCDPKGGQSKRDQLSLS